MELINYQNPMSLASRLRKKRILYLVELVDHVICRSRMEEIKIADLGGTLTYWKIFPFENFSTVNFRVDLINLDYPEYDLEESILPNVTFSRRIGDACDLSGIADTSYDIVHSNSVIEHVGSIQKVQKMAKEILRIGKNYYLQTPNFWFPIEPHFLIPFYTYLPRPVRCRLLQLRFRQDRLQAIQRDETIHLLTKSELKMLFPGAEILTERFFGFAKSFIVRTPVYQKNDAR